MIDSNSIRGFVELIVLSRLKNNDMYGYEISKEITEMSDDEYVLHEATLYAVLSRLERKKAVRSYNGEVTHGKQRKYYNITKYGLVYLEELKENFEDTTNLIEQFLEEK